MHLAGHVVAPPRSRDIPPFRSTSPPRYDMTLRPLLALGLALLTTSCSEDPTGITAGERMTVEEQVAIGSALEKAARALDGTGRRRDSLLADWTRIGYGLVSRQGQQGRLAPRVQTRGGSVATLDMRGVALRVNDGEAHIHLILAWEGLDVIQLRARRVLVLVFTGTIEEGTLPGAGGLAEGGWIDFTSGETVPAPHLLTAGTASVSAGAFSGSCPGVTDTDEFTCTTGRQSILSEATVERDTEIIDIEWDAVVLPSFRIVGAVLGS